jgi:hypothetical protein
VGLTSQQSNSRWLRREGNTKIGRAIVKLIKAIVTAAAGTLALASPAMAHHGTSTNYDYSQAFVAPAVVTQFRYRQPHPQIYFDVMDENGEATNWACEIGPNIPWLMREGWTRVRSEAALAPGIQVTVTLTPAVSGEPVCLVNKIEDGQGESVLLDFGLNRIDIVKVVEAH